MPTPLFFSFFFLDHTLLGQLTTSANQRLARGFRPNTLKNYARMFKDFLTFLVVTGLAITQVSSQILLCFMEFLVHNQMSHTNIANYMAAIRASCIIYAIPTVPFTDHRLQLFLKSLKINSNFTPTIHSSITVDTLQRIAQACTVLPHPEIFSALYLLAFFSVLRLSNILPHSIKLFDSTRQLCRGDIIFAPTHAVLIIKWSKTLQDRKTFATVTIPVLGQSIWCPVAALQTMFNKVPGSSNDPLFQIFTAGRWAPLTDSRARKHLKHVSYLLNLQPPLTFHDFRRAGTSWGFNHGVPVEHLMQHGTWKSNAVWKYISADAAAPSVVANAFRSHLHQ